MSFYYVNPGLVDLFNYFVDKNSVEQINSNIHNLECGVACTSSSAFGYFFNESVSSISGCFSLYVSSSTPKNDIFKLCFYNLSDKNALLGEPTFTIKGYPNGSILNDTYFPLSFVVGQNNVYISNDSDKCPKVLSLNKIWFRISINSSNVATFQLRINDNSIYSYTLDFNSSVLGNTMLFSLNDASVSNVLLSSSYNEVNVYQDIINISPTISASDMLIIDDTYTAYHNDQKTVFNIHMNDSMSASSPVYGAIIVNDKKNLSDNSVFSLDQLNYSTFSSVYSASSYTEYTIPDTGGVVSFVSKNYSNDNRAHGMYKFTLGLSQGTVSSVSQGGE